MTPRAAGGFGHALKKIYRAWYGRTFLGVVGLGIFAFAGYCFGESVYRVIPRRVEPAARETMREIAD